MMHLMRFDSEFAKILQFLRALLRGHSLLNATLSKPEFSKTRRDSTRVIFEVLQLALGGTSKTQIIYRANLSHKLAERYVTFLLKKGLILRVVASNGQVTHTLTEKGDGLLRLLREVEYQLEDLFLALPRQNQ